VPRWTDRARSDLLAVVRHIANDNPAAAERWLDVFLRAAEDAARLPLSGRVVPEVDQPDVRELIRPPYRLVYRVRTAAVDVLTVFEGHRLLPREALGKPDE
jgi:plasmid stabilization system protein ParE